MKDEDPMIKKRIAVRMLRTLRAMAGVRGCHVLAAPWPWVGRGCDRG